jgi:uracil-DNA glycosylase
VIKAINTQTTGVVFMLWGKKAHDKSKMIDGKKHLVLCNVHPSPLAGVGFRTVKDFGKANQYLAEQGKSEINWNL